MQQKWCGFPIVLGLLLLAKLAVSVVKFNRRSAKR